MQLNINMCAAWNLPKEYRQIQISSAGIFRLHTEGQLYQREAPTQKANTSDLSFALCDKNIIVSKSATALKININGIHHAKFQLKMLIRQGGSRVKEKKSLHIRTLRLLSGPSLPLILSIGEPPVES